MIVDDNAQMRSMIARYIRNMSTTSDFCECNNGLEAVERYKELRPDVVLMDVKMPKMDGLAATKIIRRQFPDARIIIVTNFDDSDLKAEAQKVGAEGYVLKERLFELREMMK
jgi:DNA-binding NarL/FixJ family response regulator